MKTDHYLLVRVTAPEALTGQEVATKVRRTLRRALRGLTLRSLRRQEMDWERQRDTNTSAGAGEIIADLAYLAHCACRDELYAVYLLAGAARLASNVAAKCTGQDPDEELYAALGQLAESRPFTRPEAMGPDKAVDPFRWN